jgi:hypothetical protein
MFPPSGDLEKPCKKGGGGPEREVNFEEEKGGGTL